MEPYYSEDGVTIYHGDCRDIIPLLSDVDAVVTDPPYGIGAATRSFQNPVKRGAAVAASRDYGTSDWDAAAPSPDDIAALLAIGRWHILWGGNYFGLPPRRGWLVWDKETGSNGYADCELAWTDLETAVRRFRFQWMGMLQQLPEDRWHPTQKPLPLMRWALGLLPLDVSVILDPYAGSGTTLRAAKDLGLRAIGIEVEERYCEIAAKRLGQQSLFGIEAA